MQPYTPIPEVLWRSDPLVDAARKLPTWALFHRVCGKANLFFDNIEREGRRGQFSAHAFTLVGPKKQTMHAATGKGKTPIEALVAAYRASGQAIPEAEPLLAQMLDPADVRDPFADLLGETAPIDDIERLFG